LTATAETPHPAKPKPRWRGRLHQIAFFVSIPAGVFIIAVADDGVARLAAIIYAFSLTAVFGSSAAYHRGKWSPKGLRRMKRLDHSMIFVLIAGSYTPIALVLLDGPWRWVILGLAWGGAAIGIALKLAHIDGFRIATATLYMVLGWMAVIMLPEIVRNADPLVIALAVIGGLLYTVGAIIFALNRPDPIPHVFGYHEVWHVFMVAAAATHYVMEVLIVSGRG
jgi:hemolysin III